MSQFEIAKEKTRACCGSSPIFVRFLSPCVVFKRISQIFRICSLSGFTNKHIS